MSNPLGVIPNETISFEESKVIESSAHQKETEEAQAEAYPSHRIIITETTSSRDSTTTTCNKAVNSGQEGIFGVGQFTYSDYLFDGHSDSISAQLQPGIPSITCVPGQQLHAPRQSLSIPASVPQLKSAPSHSLAPNQPANSIHNFCIDHSEHSQQLLRQQQQQQQQQPHFSSDFLTDQQNAIVGTASDSLPSNEFMLFDPSMLDTSSELSAMQEPSGTPTAKVVDYFTSPQPPPLQSSLPQDSSAVAPMSQQQLGLDSHHHGQAQSAASLAQQLQQQQQQSDDFVHFHARINGNSAARDGGHAEVQQQGLSNDTNNNPVSEDLKETINNMLADGGPLSAASINDSVSTPSNSMDPGGHGLEQRQQQQQPQTNQYIASNVAQLMEQSGASNAMDTTNNGPRQSMLVAPEHAAQQQQQQQLSQQATFSCYTDESQMQRHNFGGSNEPSSQQQQQPQQPGSGQENQRQLMSSESNLYHSHHLPAMPQPSTPHHRAPSVMGNQANQHMNHQAQSIPQQQQQQQHQHHPQHHQMVSNAPSTSSMEYGQSQIISESPSQSIDAVSNNSNQALQQQQQKQQQSLQSTNPSSANVDNMLAQKSSTPQSTSVSASGEIKPETGNYVANSTEYLLQQSAHAPNAQQYHQQIRHSEGPPPLSAPSSSTPVSSSHVPSTSQHSLVPLPNTAHQRTHYMPSSENIHSSSSSSSSNNAVNQIAGANINSQQQQQQQPAPSNGTGNVQAAEPGTNSTGAASGSGQMLNRFEQVSDSAAGPAETLNQQQQNCYVLLKCDQPSQQQPPLSYSEGHNNKSSHQSVQQMQFDVPQQSSQPMQPRLSLTDPNASTGHQMQGANSLQQVQQVQQPQQPQTQLLNSVSQPAGHQGTCEDTQQQQQQARPQPGSTFVPSNSQNSQLCISLPNNNAVVASSLQSSQVQTVTMSGMPANGIGLQPRPACVITDPNSGAALPPPPPLHQAQSQAQVNVASLANLPPKKIRFATNLSAISPGTSSLSQQQQQPTVSTALLFASKSSVTPSVPQVPVSHQPSPMPSQSSSALNTNVAQTMILPSNLAFNQAQAIQSQMQHQNAANIVASSPTPAPSLQSVAAKPFVPSSGNPEQNYSAADLLMQQARQFPSSSSVAPSSSSANVVSFPASGVSSSIQSGSQFSRVQNVPASSSSVPTSVVSSQGQLFFSNTPHPSTNIRILDNPNVNYSILALQPAHVQQQQAQQQQTQATKSAAVSQKILLHSVPVSDSSEANGNNNNSTNSPVTPAATALISLNPKFALNPSASQMATLGHLPALNNGPSAVANSTGTPLASPQLPSGSIIFSPLPLPSVTNIPGSQATRSVATNFAVPIPVVTSAIAIEPRSQSLALASIQQTAASLGQFAPAAFSPSPSQPTILSNLLPPSTSTMVQAPTLATKSSKMPSSSSQTHKSTSKSGVTSSASGSKSGSTATGGSATASGNSGTAKGLNPPPLMSDDPAKPFKCCLCGKNLASKNVYQLHLRSHSGEKPFVCHLCNNRFSQKTSLTRHMRSHTGERPFPCQVCNKRFADKERIKIHMRIHTGEKPFSCGVCGKKFSQKSTVKRHMSVHTGVKPFKCDVCGKGFANRGNLTAHTKTHQPQQAQASQQQQQQQGQLQATRSNSIGSSMASASSNTQQQQAPPQPQQQPSMAHQIAIGLSPGQMAGPSIINNISSSAHRVSLAGPNIVYTSSDGANGGATVVTNNNGVRVEIANIKLESEDVSGGGEAKGGLVVVRASGSQQQQQAVNNNPHNHQFTSATMSAGQAQSQVGQHPQQQQAAQLTS